MSDLQENLDGKVALVDGGWSNSGLTEQQL
jgi:hypothetical protein